MATQRVLEPILSVIGDLLNDFGGARQTRLTAEAAPGDAALQVERTLGMPTSGAVVVDGIYYHYTGRTLSALTGIYINQNGARVPSVQQPHGRLTPVTDASQTFSALDQLRNSYFIQTAQGTDLSICGANYGFPREPSIASDEVYRAVLLAVAYGRRGTTEALIVALDAMLGPGNYSLSDDFDAHPLEVIVTTPSATLTSSVYTGRSYLSALSDVQAAGGSLTLPGKITGAYNILSDAFPGRDFYAARNTDGQVDASDNTALVTSDALFRAEDVGKQLILSGSSVAKAYPGAPSTAPRGNNNGTYAIASVSSPASVTLRYPPIDDIQVGGFASDPNRIETSYEAFTYPDDIGKQIELQAGSSGNAGIYVIASVMSPAGTPLTSAYRATSASVTLIKPDGTVPSFAPQNQVTGVVTPRFATESNLTWVLADATDLTVDVDAETSTLTPRQPLPSGTYQVAYNVVPGGQLMEGPDALNTLTDEGPPPRFSDYPLYVADPYAYIENYLQQLVAAGVQVTFNLT